MKSDYWNKFLIIWSVTGMGWGFAMAVFTFFTDGTVSGLPIWMGILFFGPTMAFILAPKFSYKEETILGPLSEATLNNLKFFVLKFDGQLLREEPQHLLFKVKVPGAGLMSAMLSGHFEIQCSSDGKTKISGPGKLVGEVKTFLSSQVKHVA